MAADWRLEAAGAALLAAGCYWLTTRVLSKRTARREGHAGLLVVVTGCDSGLGYSLASRLHSRGLTVLATCLDVDSPGARLLLLRADVRLHVVQLDVTEAASVANLLQHIHLLLGRYPPMELRALINNAGVMVFGEFEWQTDEQILHQVSVNLLGTVRLTKALCPLIRKHRGRIVTVTSHCASEALPGLAVYGATKAALEGWSDGLRVEQAKYGVSVITVVPGYFMMNSNLMAEHAAQAERMRAAMTADDRAFFGDYFERYHAALGVLGSRREPAEIDNEPLHAMFEDAVLSPRPRAHYSSSPMRYTFYHSLFKVSPQPLRDWLVERFVALPKWQPPAPPNQHK